MMVWKEKCVFCEIWFIPKTTERLCSEHIHISKGWLTFKTRGMELLMGDRR